MALDPEFYSIFNKADPEVQSAIAQRIQALADKAEHDVIALEHVGEPDPILRRAAQYMLAHEGFAHDAPATRQWSQTLSRTVSLADATHGGANALIKAFEGMGIVPKNSPYAHERKYEPFRLASLEKPLIIKIINGWSGLNNVGKGVMQEILLLQQYKMTVQKSDEQTDTLLAGVNKAIGRRVGYLVSLINKDAPVLDQVDINKKVERGIS